MGPLTQLQCATGFTPATSVAAMAGNATTSWSCRPRPPPRPPAPAAPLVGRAVLRRASTRIDAQDPRHHGARGSRPHHRSHRYWPHRFQCPAAPPGRFGIGCRAARSRGAARRGRRQRSPHPRHGHHRRRRRARPCSPPACRRSASPVRPSPPRQRWGSSMHRLACPGVASGALESGVVVDAPDRGDDGDGEGPPPFSALIGALDTSNSRPKQLRSQRVPWWQWKTRRRKPQSTHWSGD